MAQFSLKLGTNFCPNDREVLEIQALLIAPSSRLKRLDDEIADLQKAIDKLVEQRNSVRVYVDSHRALLSPARRLPIDVIREIFMACIPTHRNCVMSAREAPILLGRICSSWRTISLSTPRLWSRLHIVEPKEDMEHPRSSLEPHTKKLAQRFETMKTWLGRSGQCPLSISFDGDKKHIFGDSDDSDEDSGSHPMLKALIPFASRSQEVSLRITSSFLPTLISFEGAFTMLKTLEITVLRVYSDYAEEVQWGPLELLRGPHISTVALNNLNTNPLALPLRWENITSLALMGHWSNKQYLTSDTVVQILSRCPQIRNCRVSVLDNSEREGESSFELPSLRSLELTGTATPSQTIMRMFSLLSLPELRHFDFRGIGGGNITFMPLLHNSVHLESLAIETDSFKKESLMGLLHALPSAIRFLNIADRFSERARSFIDEETLSPLIPSADAQNVRCPALQEFRLSPCAGPLSDKALLRFIQARMALKPATLRRVEVQFERNVELDIQPDIQPFLADGLRVVIKYNSPQTFHFSPWEGLRDEPSLPAT
ncbi:hypothetical protein B0H11DRAFT_1989085 [Mycena galericulata]|nr:hypothetical protein B0H11DRAFT_1989085 [Mycena galericulata]